MDLSVIKSAARLVPVCCAALAALLVHAGEASAQQQPDIFSQIPPDVLASMPPEIRAQIQSMYTPPKPVAIGQETKSVLSSSMGRDVYSVRLSAGQQVHITVVSDVFDTHLDVEGPNEFEASNNNQYGENYGVERNYGTDMHDSAIYLVPPAAGDYEIIVTNNEEGERSGAYVLRIVELRRFAVGTDLRDELTQTDNKNFSSAFMDVFAHKAVAGEELHLRMTSPDFTPVISIVGPDDLYMRAGSDMNVTLPTSGEYRIELQSFRPGDVGRYVVQSARGELVKPNEQGELLAERDLKPEDCKAAVQELQQQIQRLGSLRSDQYSKVKLQLARAFVCLDDLTSADSEFAAVTKAARSGSPYWMEAALARVTLAEMRGDTKSAEALREVAFSATGLGRMSLVDRLPQYGRSDFIIEPVDNIALLDFGNMLELGRQVPEAGAALLAARHKTITNSGRLSLAKRASEMYARFTASVSNEVTGCPALLQMGVAFAGSGQAAAGASALRRAYTAGLMYNRPGGPRDFRCGNALDGSGDVVDERDLVIALSQAQVLAADYPEAIRTLEEWLKIAPGDHLSNATLGEVYEAAKDTPRAIKAWRTALQFGMNIYANGLGGSIHLRAGDAFIRLGSPADAVAAYKGAAPTGGDDVTRRLFIGMAGLASQLADGDVRAPLGCPAGRAEIDLTRYGASGTAPMSYYQRPYFEYCRAWATQAVADPQAQPTLAKLLKVAQEEGWGENEVRALTEASLEANWKAAAAPN